MLEAHLAYLNTELALNTMALAAFGLVAPPLEANGAAADPEDRW